MIKPWVHTAMSSRQPEERTVEDGPSVPIDSPEVIHKAAEEAFEPKAKATEEPSTEEILAKGADAAMDDSGPATDRHTVGFGGGMEFDFDMDEITPTSKHDLLTEIRDLLRKQAATPSLQRDGGRREGVSKSHAETETEGEAEFTTEEIEDLLYSFAAAEGEDHTPEEFAEKFPEWLAAEANENREDDPLFAKAAAHFRPLVKAVGDAVFEHAGEAETEA